MFYGPPGSGPGSFYHPAKIVRKTSIPTVLWLLFDAFSLNNDVNVPSKSTKQENRSFLEVASWRSMMKIAGSGFICQRHVSADPDPDPHQNVMDPQHCADGCQNYWSGLDFFKNQSQTACI
jgi:hypothetical protein